jgi:hypothetical protein
MPAGILAYLAINKAPGLIPGAAIAYFVIFNNSLNTASGSRIMQTIIHIFLFLHYQINFSNRSARPAMRPKPIENTPI